MTAPVTAAGREEQQSADAIRCLSIPLENGALLLPYTAVAEVTEFGELTPLTNGPGWLLGLLRWRGVTVPVLTLEGLVGTANGPTDSPEKVVVCNTLNGNPKLPFLAVAASGVPRLTWAQRDTINTMENARTGERPGALGHMHTPDGDVIIPDFDVLEQMLLRLGL
ncbi:chemotaxis protein CheW [Thiohalomonas denitrificans]|uniref:Chemosensory pili system protein ChpC n=1 Tax=Thiohalomonas denitrificans TaxID=415747 RepID=A0A1G5QIY8_9GAMM|nr:chemotaxis protein CheW [Thiohalomonas denitrificans]SCZ61825.1 chemosensory pili system protein ChpC [Thiohalomonas denitrificans]